MTSTKGNIIIEDIKVGDIHYEFEYGIGIKSEVISEPKFNKEHNLWQWKSRNVSTGRIIDYAVNPRYSYYGPNLYDYEAYSVNKWM